MATPEQPAEISAHLLQEQDQLRRIDAVYACCAFLGLSMTAFGVVGAFTEGQTQAGYGMLLFLDLPLPMLAAFAATVVLTVKSRRYRPLLVLCAIHVLFLTAIALVIWSQSPEGARETPVDVAFLGYGAFFTLVPVWWFALGRRRYRRQKALIVA